MHFANAPKEKVGIGNPAYYLRIDYQTWTSWHRILRSGLRVLFRALVDITIDGRENVPVSGGGVIAINHVSLLDPPLILGLCPRRLVMIAMERWRRWPVIGWFFNRIADTIYVSRVSGSEANEIAMQCAVNALKTGGCILIAPEGGISKKRSLMRGKKGVAVLATRSGSPVVPVAIWGQEKAFRYWLRLRRVPVTMRFGEAVRFTAESADALQLEAYTERIMESLAALLPPEYCGVYREKRGKGKVALICA